MWAILFTLLSLYWAAGGTAGGETIGDAITDPALAREAGMVAFLWATVLLKALAVVLALALVQPWGTFGSSSLVARGRLDRRVDHDLLGRCALWLQHGLMEAGVVGVAESMDATAIGWHLVLWDLFWVTGGLLFLGATRYFQTQGPARKVTHQSRTGVSASE